MANEKLFVAGAAGLFQWIGNPATLTFSFDHGLKTGEKIGVRFVGGDGAGKSAEKTVQSITPRSIRIETNGLNPSGGFGAVPNGFLRFYKVDQVTILDPVKLPSNFGNIYPDLGLFINLDIPDYVEPLSGEDDRGTMGEQRTFGLDPLNTLFQMDEENRSGLSSGFGSNENGVTTDQEVENCNCKNRSKALWIVLAAAAAWYIWKKWR